MQNSKISVIIPVYNIKEYVSACLESVIAQTYENFEAIVIDDGSSDGSAAVLDDFAAKDKRIKVFHIENGGVSNARNLGLEKAVGEYIFFLDGDDFLSNNSLEILYTASGGKFDIVQAGRDIVDSDGNSKPLSKYYSKEITDKNEALANYFLEIIAQSVCNKLYKASVINELRFDSSLAVGEDSAFVYSLCKTASFKLIPDITYHYSTREGSAIHSKAAEKHFAPLRLFDMQAEECKENRDLFIKCQRRNVLYYFYLLRLILRSDGFSDRIPMLRKRILSCKWQILFTKYYPLRYKIGLLLLWLFPKLFYKYF